jgi:hypothetical protein
MILESFPWRMELEHHLQRFITITQSCLGAAVCHLLRTSRYFYCTLKTAPSEK